MNCIIKNYKKAIRRVERMHLVIKLPILIIRNITQRINIFYAKRISFCLRRNSKFASKHLNIYKENKRTL